MFSVGVGGKKGVGWMDTVERENNVKLLAASRYHYACTDHWTTIIQNAMAQDGTNTGRLL